jgi:hypothetical protein
MVNSIISQLLIQPALLLIMLLTQINSGYGSWTAPKTIPGYHPETWPPILMADQKRTVHAFSSQWVGEGENQARVIMYNRGVMTRAGRCQSRSCYPLKKKRAPGCIFGF